MSAAPPARAWHALRQSLQRRWLARLPRQDQLALTQRNVYILPTGAGWMLALTLAVLLVASINYQLNLGYLLTFLLAGSAAAGMLAGHANLRGMCCTCSRRRRCSRASAARCASPLTPPAGARAMA